MKLFWTPAALAKEYPVSKSLIYAACKSGLLVHYRVPSGRGKKGKYLIAEKDFLCWLESCRVEGKEIDEGELKFL